MELAIYAMHLILLTPEKAFNFIMGASYGVNLLIF